MANQNTEAQPQGRLAYFPVNIFAITMGLGGFTIATSQLERVMGWTHLLSRAALFFTLAVFVLLLTFYLVKSVRHPLAVRAEWKHPIKISFFPAITISLIILSIALLHVNKTASATLWWIGAPLNLLATLFVVRHWIREGHYETLHLNPAWFIPAVGNILVPIVGVAHAHVEISWFFFSVGVLFWINLMAIIFNRLIFHHPLPENLLPTLFILIAPPAVGFLAYSRLMPDALDPFGRFLFYSGVLFFLLLITKVNILVRLPFSLAWWAYSFPLAALTLSLFRFAEMTNMSFYTTAGMVLYALLALVIALLLLRTLKAIMNNKICVPH